MLALIDFVVRLVTDVGRFADVFIELLVGSGDPLTVVSYLLGQVFLVSSVTVLGYLTVGALLNELGLSLPSLGRGRTE